MPTSMPASLRQNSLCALLEKLLPSFLSPLPLSPVLYHLLSRLGDWRRKGVPYLPNIKPFMTK